ncbi:hypothetical protein TNCV_557771 [Trichonephila clavipes]|nr:hypothetical protein TNCV_557771 [Trichonephila clavipes]
MVDFRPSTMPPSLGQILVCANAHRVIGMMRRSPQNVSTVHRSIAIDVMPTLGIVPLRHGVTLNSLQAASPLLCVGGWETEVGRPLLTHRVFSL